MTGAREGLFNVRQLDQSLAGADNPLPLFRAALRDGRAQLRKRFFEHSGATLLVTAHARLIDQLIVRAWRRHLALLPAGIRVALGAVGGQRRGGPPPAPGLDLMGLV